MMWVLAVAMALHRVLMIVGSGGGCGGGSASLTVVVVAVVQRPTRSGSGWRVCGVVERRGHQGKRSHQKPLRAAAWYQHWLGIAKCM